MKGDSSFLFPNAEQVQRTARRRRFHFFIFGHAIPLGESRKASEIPPSGAATLFYYLTRCKPSALSRYTCVQTSSKYFRS